MRILSVACLVDQLVIASVGFGLLVVLRPG